MGQEPTRPRSQQTSPEGHPPTIPAAQETARPSRWTGRAGDRVRDGVAVVHHGAVHETHRGRGRGARDDRRVKRQGAQPSGDTSEHHPRLRAAGGPRRQTATAGRRGEQSRWTQAEIRSDHVTPGAAPHCGREGRADHDAGVSEGRRQRGPDRLRAHGTRGEAVPRGIEDGGRREGRHPPAHHAGPDERGRLRQHPRRARLEHGQDGREVRGRVWHRGPPEPARSGRDPEFFLRPVHGREEVLSVIAVGL